MYCPKCGSENQPEVKFCTRCGANLGVVSEAMSGKFESASEMDERLVSLLKNYYRGRRLTAAGFLLSALMIFKLGLSMFMGMGGEFLWLAAILGVFLILGLVWFIWGATSWNNASSELKALGYDRPGSAVPGAKKAAPSLPSASTVLQVKSYDTGSIKPVVEAGEPGLMPPSITEQTTRNLEDEGAKLPLPDQATK